MSFDYTRSRATAERLLAKYGQAAIITRTTSVGDDWNPRLKPANHPCTIVVTDFKNREIDGTLVQAGDKKVIVSTSGLTIEPATGDKIAVGGFDHSIVSVKPINPGGLVIIYQLQCRR